MKRASPSSAPPCDEATRIAIAAVLRGDAAPGQQRKAMAYMLADLAGVMAIEPATLTAEERAFVAGRRWVGMCFAALGGARLMGFDPTPEDAD